jgi:hypothetical protein
VYEVEGIETKATKARVKRKTKENVNKRKSVGTNPTLVFQNSHEIQYNLNY